MHILTLTCSIVSNTKHSENFLSCTSDKILCLLETGTRIQETVDLEKDAKTQSTTLSIFIIFFNDKNLADMKILQAGGRNCSESVLRVFGGHFETFLSWKIFLAYTK